MKSKIITFLFVGCLIFYGVLGILFEDAVFSVTERRKFASVPKFVFSNEYIEDLDKYILDQFPFRDQFRSIKAKFNYNILGKLDNNGVFLKDGYIYKSIYPTNIDSINNFLKKTDKVSNDFLDNNIYLMIIPDKNYYLDDDKFLNIDYDYIYNRVNELGFININIRDLMDIHDYYETDTHFRQERLDKVVQRMGMVMNFNYYNVNYEVNVYDKFYGVYYGEALINRKPERLVYLDSEIFDSVSVKYLENDKLNSIYNLDKLEGMDAYEVYLDGASAFIEIYNSGSNINKELIVFRDSFGSSLVPLLVPYYRKITLIDNRYINSDNYRLLIEKNNQDILFMYSTLLVNNSSSLKG